MLEFLQNNWQLLSAFFSGGGLLSILTVKYSKMKAQADAVKEWQQVYQETIRDLREDKNLMKEDIAELRKASEKHTQDIEELKGYECTVMDCALRKRRRWKPKV